MDANFIQNLQQRLQRQPPRVQAEWEARPAAVLVPLYEHTGEWHLLFTQRNANLSEHSGQVSFPGGAVEPGDRDRIETALRETEEEIGLRPADVSVLGTLDELITVTQWRITPVVGTFPHPYQFRINHAEAETAFGVPLRWLADPANLEAQYRQPPIPGPKVKVYYFKDYEGHVIWGATARLVVSLLQVAGLKQGD